MAVGTEVEPDDLDSVVAAMEGPAIAASMTQSFMGRYAF